MTAPNARRLSRLVFEPHALNFGHATDSDPAPILREGLRYKGEPGNTTWWPSDRRSAADNASGYQGPGRFYVFGAVGNGVLRAVERSLRAAVLDAAGPDFAPGVEPDERFELALYEEGLLGGITHSKDRLLVHALHAGSSEEDPSLPDGRFVLPARYVKGAYDRQKGEIMRNQAFQPSVLDRARLARNIERLLE